MSREVIFTHEEWGEHRILIIFERDDGKWSGEWEKLRSSEAFSAVSNLISYVGRLDYEEALAGNLMPFLRALQLPPEACLIKVGEPVLHCSLRESCSMYDEEKCWGDNEDVPGCFLPSIPKSEEELLGEAQALLGRVIDMWRDGQYVVVITEGTEENE